MLHISSGLILFYNRRPYQLREKGDKGIISPSHSEHLDVISLIPTQYKSLTNLMIKGPLSSSRFLSVVKRWRRFSRNLVKYSSTLPFSSPGLTARNGNKEHNYVYSLTPKLNYFPGRDGMVLTVTHTRGQNDMQLKYILLQVLYGFGGNMKLFLK